MFRVTDVATSGSGGAAPEPPAGTTGPHADLPGELDSLLSDAPSFRTRLNGYDRLQVDNYVAWAESELATGRRQIDHLLARYGDASAELEISRRLLAQAPKGVDLSSVSDRVRDILRLASDEATEMIGAAREEADHLLAEARVEADARLRKAHEIKELAAETADEMLAHARRERTEAATMLERARAQTAELVRNATTERDRLAGEAAEAHQRLVAVQAELDDLQRQRDDARTALHRLTDRIAEALSVVTGGPPDQYVLLDNHVVDERVESMST
jgi:cell division septum initiation protein DivIVA